MGSLLKTNGVILNRKKSVARCVCFGSFPMSPAGLLWRFRPI